MKTKLSLALLAVAVTACSKEAAPPPPPPPPVAAPAPAPEPAAPPAPALAAAEPAKAAASAEAAKAAAAPPAVKVAEPKPAASPKPAAAPVLETKHVKVGDAKCRMCHRLQHDSWSSSPHAAKGLDCEGCHGGGADFVKVMRDRTAALAAGLMLPKKDFCKRCHKADWQDAMYLRVHAHKAR